MRARPLTVNDALPGIAKAQLGQAGRFVELAVMNYDRYPSLKTDPTIQVGWILRLPRLSAGN